MKIAIPLIESRGENSMISEHFGHAPYFGFVDLKEDGSYSVEVIANPLESHGPGDIPNYLNKNGVNLLIARGVGGRAIDFFNRLGIKVIRGAYGTVKELIENYKEEKLQDTDYEVKEKFHEH